MRIVNFHGIGRPERKLEPGEAPYWITSDQFNAIIDLVSSRPNFDRIRLTFDDGNKSDITQALPLLQQRGLTATFFVLTGRIGTLGSLDTADIRTLVQAGMDVGSHGILHVDWRRLSATGLKRELAESRARLEDICGLPVTSAAIPFGAYNRKVLSGLAAAGYTRSYSSDGGGARETAFLQGRKSVVAGMKPSDMAAFLSAEEPIMRRLRRGLAVMKKRLI